MKDDHRPDKHPVAGFGTVPFETWITTVASFLTEDLGSRNHYDASTPGSVSEAAAYLLSEAGLAPDADGHPTLTGHGGIVRIDDYEKLGLLLYSAAFPEDQHHNWRLDLFTRFESDLADTQPPQEREEITVIKAVGVLHAEAVSASQQQTGTLLVFHEAGLHLSEMVARNIEDLLHLYNRVRSAAIFQPE